MRAALRANSAPSVTAFAATVAAEVLRAHDGFLLWAASLPDCYPPGLARLGLNPSRIVWAGCSKDAEVLSVMEEALHSKALAAVLGEAGALSLKTALRLDAAARQSGTTALLLRRHRSKPSQAAALNCGAAATRWRVSAVPGGYRHPGEANPLRHPGNAKGVIRDLLRTRAWRFLRSRIPASRFRDDGPRPRPAALPARPGILPQWQNGSVDCGGVQWIR